MAESIKIREIFASLILAATGDKAAISLGAKRIASAFWFIYPYMELMKIHIIK